MIRLAVFGAPVAHSLSPRIHCLFARQFGLDVDYRAIEASAATFAERVLKFAAQGARGCNVTVPFKTRAYELADRASELARRAGAANTLLFEPHEWYADNTDGAGLLADLEGLPGVRLTGGRVCLLGAGGAAAGVLAALLAHGPRRVVIVNRTRERAVALAESHADLGTVEARTPAEAERAGPFDLVINATSLGHDGVAPELTASWFEAGGLCCDLNYGRAAQPLASLCARLGVAYRDGLGMLVRQAALSFELWTGNSPATAPVLATLRHE
ncbi:MAG: shikimate dehydrogenase [Xanthomonadales bacterium]|nr:shikimate dehydrogenase [Xanthomonadales bacterium]